MPFARVVSFDGVSAERIAEMQGEMENSDQPDDVPAKELIVLHDPEAAQVSQDAQGRVRTSGERL